ncbi:hypothetical protein CsSME_00043171 [Camellia sinensis var. sinensis]
MKLGMDQKMITTTTTTKHDMKEDGFLGVAIHSQVKKIKQEMEKIKQPSLQQSEIRLVLRDITWQQQHQRRRSCSRSPLGLAATPISVGNS